MRQSISYQNKSTALSVIPFDGKAPLKLTFTLQEAAIALGVTGETVRQLIARGHIRRLPLRHIRISAVELNRFLAEGCK